MEETTQSGGTHMDADPSIASAGTDMDIDFDNTNESYADAAMGKVCAHRTGPVDTSKPNRCQDGAAA